MNEDNEIMRGTNLFLFYLGIITVCGTIIGKLFSKSASEGSIVKRIFHVLFIDFSNLKNQNENFTFIGYVLFGWSGLNILMEPAIQSSMVLDVFFSPIMTCIWLIIVSNLSTNQMRK